VKDAATIRPGEPDDLRVHGLELLDEHYDELCVDKGALRLDPAWDRYESLIASGAMFALCVWIGSELIGYSACLVQPHLHYRRSIWAYNDVLFVRKQHRRGTIGVRLIKATEEEAAKRGANVMAWHAKEGTALQEILPSMSYRLQETIYTRNL